MFFSPLDYGVEDRVVRKSGEGRASYTVIIRKRRSWGCSEVSVSAPLSAWALPVGAVVPAGLGAGGEGLRRCSTVPGCCGGAGGGGGDGSGLPGVLPPVPRRGCTIRGYPWQSRGSAGGVTWWGGAVAFPG